jgi:hypothetical protein
VWCCSAAEVRWSPVRQGAVRKKGVAVSQRTAVGKMIIDHILGLKDCERYVELNELFLPLEEQMDHS